MSMEELLPLVIHLEKQVNIATSHKFSGISIAIVGDLFSLGYEINFSTISNGIVFFSDLGGVLFGTYYICSWCLHHAINSMS